MTDHVIGRRRIVNGSTVALVLATGLLASTAAMQVVPGVLGPLLQTDLHMSQATLGLLSTAAFGGMAMGMLPGGFLTDRFGERTMMAIGVGGAGIAMLAGSFADTSNLLLIAFLVASVGAAFAASGGPKTIVRWFAPGRRGTAMGIRQTGVPLGGLLASLILPTVAVLTDWRTALRFTALVAIAAAIAFYVFYRDPAEVAAVQSNTGSRWTFLNRRFLAATACAFTLQAAQGCALAYVTVDVHGTFGLTAAVAALFLGLVQVGGLAGRVAWGAVGDWVGSSRALTSVTVVGLACCAGMASLNPGTSLVVVGIVCLGLGMSAVSWNAVYINMIAAMAPDRSTASVLALGLTVALLGFLLVPVFGHIADIGQGFRMAWIALAGLMAVGAAFSVLAATGHQPARP
jgi:MFS transporter, ACS family, hexuronate transporter